MWTARCLLARTPYQVIKAKSISHDCSKSTTIPMWKNKGDIAGFSTYRPNRVMSQTQKIFERVFETLSSDYRVVVQIVRVCKKCRYCLRHPYYADGDGKYREQRRELHVAFLDMEKAFDRVPHDVMGIAKAAGSCFQNYTFNGIYYDAINHVQTAARQSAPVRIKSDVHQESVLFPLLFIKSGRSDRRYQAAMGSPACR
ncbi:unnamed protein product [Strongylus vulgaris]|uniref:Reverse transcriptase domain-containing protein n=1 Tax=Strongylus vulgaris TaxID=40348 RepID=A0A3P7IM39_STRVU|nr:unnamed protein product [Strongylus vulgaris]